MSNLLNLANKLASAGSQSRISSKLITGNSDIPANSQELPAPKATVIDQDKIYGDALKYSNIAADNSNRQLTNRESATSQQAASNYQQKANIDATSNMINQQNSKYNDKPASGDLGGYTDGLTRYDAVVSGSPYAPTVTYVGRKDKDVAMAQMQNQFQRQAAADDYSNQARQNEAQRLASINNSRQQYNLSAQQGNTQRDVASINAQGNVLSSLIGSFGANSGSPNYRFWS